jgi:hypothetical protein
MHISLDELHSNRVRQRRCGGCMISTTRRDRTAAWRCSRNRTVVLNYSGSLRFTTSASSSHNLAGAAAARAPPRGQRGCQARSAAGQGDSRGGCRREASTGSQRAPHGDEDKVAHCSMVRLRIKQGRREDKVLENDKWGPSTVVNYATSVWEGFSLWFS